MPRPLLPPLLLQAGQVEEDPFSRPERNLAKGRNVEQMQKNAEQVLRAGTLSGFLPLNLGSAAS